MEEAYSNGLRKLARRNIEGADLGYAASWTKDDWTDTDPATAPSLHHGTL